MITTSICRLIAAGALALSLFNSGGCSSSETTSGDKLAGGEHDMTDLRPLTPKPRKYQFYFYPNATVYRDCQVDRWFWLEGGVWQFGSTLPGLVMLDGEIPIAIELESDTPYAHYEVVQITGDSHAQPVRSASENDPSDDETPGPGRHGRGKAKGHSKNEVRSATGHDRSVPMDD